MLLGCSEGPVLGRTEGLELGERVMVIGMVILYNPNWFSQETIKISRSKVI